MVVPIMDARAGEAVVHCSVRLASMCVWRRHVDTAVEVLVKVRERVAFVPYFIGPFLVAAFGASMVG